MSPLCIKTLYMLFRAPVTFVNILLKTTVTISEVNVHVSWPVNVNHRCYLNIQAYSVKYENRRQKPKAVYVL